MGVERCNPVNSTRPSRRTPKVWRGNVNPQRNGDRLHRKRQTSANQIALPSGGHSERHLDEPEAPIRAQTRARIEKHRVPTRTVSICQECIYKHGPYSICPRKERRTDTSPNSRQNRKNRKIIL